jgi:hypothetical protein
MFAGVAAFGVATLHSLLRHRTSTSILRALAGATRFPVTFNQP